MALRDLIGELTDDEDFIELVEHVAFPRKAKVYRKRENQFEKWSDEEFRARFRLSKHVVRVILEEIEDEIATKSNRNKAVSAVDKLLLTLRFYATGSILQVAGDFMGVHKSTASQIVNQVSIALARLRPIHVRMPETEEERKQIRDKFYNISKFPFCIGALDCTHVKIQSPGGEEPEVYRNRKSFFSINVQAICDPDLTIRNIVARWPGSTHDSTIFNNSSIHAKFENGDMGDNLIVGDAGYPVKKYLITPLSNPVLPEEHLFQEAQIRTRNCIERCFGVWKRRFPILALGIKLDIVKVEAIIVATAVLHNIACSLRDEEPAVVDQEVENHINLQNEINPVDQGLLVGNINTITRYWLINDYFKNLL